MMKGDEEKEEGKKRRRKRKTVRARRCEVLQGGITVS